MIAEAGLSAVVYVPPALGHAAPSLSLAVLRTLSHLAFVIEKFGGAGHGAFPELKRTFYLALDILAEHQAESEHFVQQSCEGLWSDTGNLSHPVRRAKKAFALSAIEQLISVLSASAIRTFVLPFCSPHLDDARHREIFEAAHSVVLAILSHSAQNLVEVDKSVPDPDGSHEHERSMLITSMVPFYVQCLIKNSTEGKLNTSQLRLAFAALVKSASSTGDYALPWFSIQSLLNVCNASSPTTDGDRVHRLHLALVSSVSSVPLTLLPRLLLAVKSVIETTKDDDVRHGELLEALFEEIINNVGDAEKALAVCWWNEQCAEWDPHVRSNHVGQEGGAAMLVRRETEEPSRL
ncbi:hypothetical protein ID866_5274 [Astraeus odoratus]|nr:hypothetical protein ID866_5274 [Astraeus odoratus]